MVVVVVVALMVVVVASPSTAAWSSWRLALCSSARAPSLTAAKHGEPLLLPAQAFRLLACAPVLPRFADPDDADSRAGPAAPSSTTASSSATAAYFITTQPPPYVNPPAPPAAARRRADSPPSRCRRKPRRFTACTLVREIATVSSSVAQVRRRPKLSCVLPNAAACCAAAALLTRRSRAGRQLDLLWEQRGGENPFLYLL